MKLFFIRFKDLKINRYCGNMIPEGCFYAVNNVACITEELAHEYIRSICKPRILKPEMFELECVDLHVDTIRDQYVYQVFAWIHEDNDKPFGYFYSYPYASPDEAYRDKLWIDASNTIFFNNRDRHMRAEYFKNYYDISENDNFLRQIGCVNPFFVSLDGTKAWVKYEAGIHKIPIVKTKEDIGRIFSYLRED